jgi:hypothetical protein
MRPCSRSSKPFEEKFLDGVKQVAQEASDRTKEQWKSILDNIPRGGTDTGALEHGKHKTK